VLCFSYFRSRDGERWILSGQLCRPWIEGLRSLWRCFRYRAPHGHVVVDIRELTAVDTVGSQFMAEMRKAGVDFTEKEMEESPVAENGASTAPSGDAGRAEDRQKP
jgi:hypothetical protein